MGMPPWVKNRTESESTNAAYVSSPLSANKLANRVFPLPLDPTMPLYPGLKGSVIVSLFCLPPSVHTLKLTDSKNFVVFDCGRMEHASEVRMRLSGSLIANRRESRSQSKSIQVYFFPISPIFPASLKRKAATVVFSSEARPSDIYFRLFSPPSTAIAWL